MAISIDRRHSEPSGRVAGIDIGPLRTAAIDGTEAYLVARLLDL